MYAGVDGYWSLDSTSLDWQKEANRRTVRYVDNGVVSVAMKWSSTAPLFPTLPCPQSTSVVQRSSGYEYLQNPPTIDEQIRAVPHNGAQERFSGVPLNSVKVGRMFHFLKHSQH